jgi:hypothetical protein
MSLAFRAMAAPSKADQRAECLLLADSGDQWAPPGFSFLLPGFELFGVDARACQKKWRIEVSPQGATGEIRQLQVVPRRLDCVASEGVPRIEQLLNYLAVLLLNRNSLWWFKDRPLVGRKKWRMRRPIPASGRL